MKAHPYIIKITNVEPKIIRHYYYDETAKKFTITHDAIRRGKYHYVKIVNFPKIKYARFPDLIGNTTLVLVNFTNDMFSKMKLTCALDHVVDIDIKERDGRTRTLEVFLSGNFAEHKSLSIIYFHNKLIEIRGHIPAHLKKNETCERYFRGEFCDENTCPYLHCDVKGALIETRIWKPTQSQRVYMQDRDGSWIEVAYIKNIPKRVSQSRPSHRS